MRIVGLVPAAGSSRRMGIPKLVLSLGEESVIERVVRSLEQGGAEAVMVVAPPVSEAGAVVLANHARIQGATVVHCPAPTADMRASVEFGLDAIVEHETPPDVILLCPGDTPGISPELVARIVRELRQHPGRLVVPVCQRRRGHPLGLPWGLARAIFELPTNTGINLLVARQAGALVEVPVEDPDSLDDMDTPEDYRRWVGGDPDPNR